MGLAAVFIKTGTSPGTLYYIHKDHLGSITALTNTSGTIVEQYAYDPWGRRRNPQDWSFTNVPTPSLIHHGFTGHEHIDEISLINMNGRVYDPVLGMFISCDNFVQSPTQSQNFNRYSYCMGNPLKFTDPDGEIIWFIVAIAVVNASINVYQNWDKIKEAKGWTAVGRFAGFAAIGAGQGILSAVYGPVGGIIGGTLQSGLNSALRGDNLENVLKNTGYGLISSTIGVGTGFGMEKLTSLGLNGLGIENALARNITTKVMGSLAQSFTTTLSDGLVRGYGLKQSFKNASNWMSLTMAGLSGVADGFYTTYANRANNNDTNNSNQPDPNPNTPVDNGMDINRVEPMQPLTPIYPNFQPNIEPIRPIRYLPMLPEQPPVYLPRSLN